MNTLHSRRAFTLIETVISLSIMSVILLGLGGAVMVGSNAIPTATQTGIEDQQVVDSLNMLRSDLSQAVTIVYQTRTAGKRITLAMKDTGAAGYYAEVQYQYISSSKIFTRQIKGGDEVILFDNIDKAEFLIALEDKDAMVVWILLDISDTIQPIFELHILLPDKPELL